MSQTYSLNTTQNRQVRVTCDTCGEVVGTFASVWLDEFTNATVEHKEKHERENAGTE